MGLTWVFLVMDAGLIRRARGSNAILWVRLILMLTYIDAGLSTVMFLVT